MIVVGLIFGLAELLEVFYIASNKFHFALKYLVLGWVVFKVACWTNEKLLAYI